MPSDDPTNVEKAAVKYTVLRDKINDLANRVETGECDEAQAWRLIVGTARVNGVLDRPKL